MKFLFVFFVSILLLTDAICQQKSKRLMLVPERGELFYYFISHIEITGSDTAIYRSNIQPYEGLVSFDNLKSDNYEIKIVTFFDDTIIQNVQLKKKNNTVALPQIYSETSAAALIENVKKNGDFCFYRFDIHHQSFEMTGYTRIIGCADLQFAKGTYFSRDYDFMGDESADSLIVYTANDTVIRLITNLIKSDSITGQIDEKQKKIPVGSYPVTAIESEKHIVIIEHCAEADNAFQKLKDYIIEHIEEVNTY